MILDCSNVVNEGPFDDYKTVSQIPCMRISFHLFRYFGKRGCDTSSAMKHERWSLHDVVQQCKQKRLDVEPEHLTIKA